jgi:hypothetical protein
MEELENKLIDSVNDVDNDLQMAKEQNSDPNTIAQLEKNLIQVKAKLRFVADDAEALLKKKDTRLRGPTKGEAAADRGMCNKEKTFL